jgi:hypothetical protein
LFFVAIFIVTEKSWAGLVGIWIILSSMIFGLTETWIVHSAPNGVYMFFVLSLMAFSVNNTQSASDTTLA